METRTDRPVAIVAGGGIGGLVAALCLDAAGIHAVVYEIAREIRALGVGINLLPHAVRVLSALGLGDRLASTGIAIADLRYFTKRGEPIWSEPRGIDAGYRWPQYSIHRGELQLLLLEAVRARLGHDRVITGHRLDGFTQSAHGIEARFVNRAAGDAPVTVRGDLLVGADGIHSVVRAHYYPDEREPVFSGRLLWRGVTEAPAYLSGRTMIMAGHANQKFVAYPIGTTPTGRTRVNWVAERRVGGDVVPVARDWNRVVDVDTFLPHFAGWHFPWLDVPRLIEAAGTAYEFPMSDRDPVDRWSFQRVTLLGDAAHPMYPIGSNGSSQAILDAVALAGALRGLTLGDDPAPALARYESARLGPTARVVLSNREQGPEAVMQVVEARAPNGFARLEDVISHAELEQTASRYKRLAGFDPDALNRQGNALFPEARDGRA
jgi:2-polyprenyl-6-methoxyphenol hydroxylase-like FAD-dependent oxidoreductase